MVKLQPVRELLASLWKKMLLIEGGGEFIQSDVWHLKTATHLLNKMYFLSVLFPFLLTWSQFNISQQCNFSIKYYLARSCFQYWPKIGDEGDKIPRKKTGEANYDTERGIFNWILSHSGLWKRYGPYFSLCIERRSLKTGKQLVIFTFLRLSPPCASSG